MNDLEITKLCAEAMGYTVYHADCETIHCNETGCYYPLQNDEQAMALIKKFKLSVGEPFADGENKWLVNKSTKRYPGGDFNVFSSDLNRAICECVAKMQGECQ